MTYWKQSGCYPGIVSLRCARYFLRSGSVVPYGQRFLIPLGGTGTRKSSVHYGNDLESLAKVTNTIEGRPFPVTLVCGEIDPLKRIISANYRLPGKIHDIQCG